MSLYNTTVDIFHPSCGSQLAQPYLPLWCGFCIPQIQGYVARYHRISVHFLQRQTLCLHMKPRDAPQSSTQSSRAKTQTLDSQKHQILKDTGNLNFDFSSNLVSCVCTYGKLGLCYSIRNHSITFYCAVQAPDSCRTQLLWVWFLWKSWAGGQCASFGLWGYAAWVAVLAEPCRWAQPCGTFPQHDQLWSWKSQTNRVIPQLLSGAISKHRDQGWKKERTTTFLRLCVIPPQQFSTNSAKLLHKTFPWGESILAPWRSRNICKSSVGISTEIFKEYEKNPHQTFFRVSSHVQQRYHQGSYTWTIFMIAHLDLPWFLGR